ncbi:MAG: ABC transporter substrate-binding protein [Alphaproteobacteria bacterium]
MIASIAQSQEVKIGFLSTFSGPPAAIGQDMKNAWDLGIEHLGGKLGGLTPTVLVGDDQTKSEVGISVIDKWLNQDKVDFVVGPIWSNVLMAIKDPIIRAGKIIINPIAGATPMSSTKCSPNHFSTSWNAESWSEAAGEMANVDGIQKVFFLAPNYQAGKDMRTGFARTFKGQVVGEIFFKLNNTDFQAELSEVRAAKPQAVFFFGPGGMGVSFFKQWAASGISKDVKLYSVSTVDFVTLGGIGDGAAGTFFPTPFDHEGKNPVAVRFVRDFVAKYKRTPSHYAAPTYDATIVLDHAIKAVNGDLRKTKEMILATRALKTEWTRGAVIFNTNQIPIQNWYKQTVVLTDGKPDIKTQGIIFTARKDSYYHTCKMPF